MTNLLAQATEFNLYQEAVSQNLPGVSGDLSNVADRGFGHLLSTILSAVMMVAALLVLIILIWGAIDWISAGGDSGKVGKARDKITQAVIGIIVLSATTAIFMLLQSFLGFSLLNFGGGSSSRSSSSSSSSSVGCTLNQRLNDGGAGGYCTQGAAIVECHAADDHLPYNHYDPCSCVDGSQYQASAYDFSTCN